jgi:hypothetical protein
MPTRRGGAEESVASALRPPPHNFVAKAQYLKLKMEIYQIKLKKNIIFKGGVICVRV